MSFQIETPDSSSEGRETKLFPDQHSHDMNITAHALTTDFLIYASDVSGLPVGDIVTQGIQLIADPLIGCTLTSALCRTFFL